MNNYDFDPFGKYDRGYDWLFSPLLLITYLRICYYQEEFGAFRKMAISTICRCIRKRLENHSANLANIHINLIKCNGTYPLL